MAADGEVKSIDQVDVSARFLVDPYQNWAVKQNIPIHEDFGFDLLALKTAPWGFYEAEGCFAHAHGRGDFMANYVLQIPKGGKTKPVKHLYEATFYGLAGRGSTTVWSPKGEKRTFEWGPKSVFSIPLNCQYQMFNGSGQEPARLSVTNDAPITLNLYHNEGFVFNNSYEFPERIGSGRHFEGEGELLQFTRTGKAQVNVWETNFIDDLTKFKLYSLSERGKDSMNVTFVLADGTMHAHTSEIPVGRYKKAHRHAAGTHVHACTGSGYSLLWYEGDSEFKEIPWRHGIMYVPPFWMMHQHFNTSNERARYLACSLGSRRYPFISLRRKSAEGGGSTAIQDGGRQIEYKDQDPRLHRRFLEALKKNGVQSSMGDVFDEDAIMKLDPAKLVGEIKMPRSIGPAV